MLRARAQHRVRALRTGSVTLLQTAAAASLSYLVAHDVVGHRNAFFAPIAAVIVLGLVPGNRTRRTIEMVVGVAVGIAVGEALIAVIGTGPAQIGIVVLLAMVASVLLGGGPLISSQAASSAVLVATIRTSSGNVVPSRFVDALIGGGIGIAVLALAPRDPARLARRAAAPVVAGLAGTLEDVAGALEERDLAAAQRALDRARAGDRFVAILRDELVTAEETTRLAPVHWRDRGRIARYREVATPIEFAVRNVRVIARAAIRAIELEPQISPRLPGALRTLARVVRLLPAELDGEGDADSATHLVTEAVGVASGVLGEPRGFATDVVLGQIRSLATDLLRAYGVAQDDAVETVRVAAGERRRRSPRSPAAGRG